MEKGGKEREKGEKGQEKGDNGKKRDKNYHSIRIKFYCLILIILCTIRVSTGGRLTRNCLASNGTCGKKGFTCVDSLGERWIDKGKCCYGKPCCKYFSGVTNYSCGFETVASCIFKDSSLDDFNWLRNSGSTDTEHTGPSSAAEGTYYKYIDVHGLRNGARAILTTDATNLQACPYCLSFKYHMYGTAIGSLEVFAGDKTSSLKSIWKKIGEQTQDHDTWDTGTIDIPLFSNLAVTIEGTRGKGFRGDIAIDDILLKAGACNALG